MTKISNNPVQRDNGIYSKIYWYDFFNNETVEKIVKYCTSSELQNSTISDKNPVVNDSIRRSSVNFHNYNSENSWIFDRLNFAIEDINSKFFHFDLIGYNFFQYSEYSEFNSGKYDFHMDLVTVAPVTKGVRKSIAIWVEGPKFK